MIGNRNKPEDYRKAIQDARELHTIETGKPLVFDLVVDYCAYDSDAIETSLNALDPPRENFKLYLYISTDSVYDASPFTLGKEDPYRDHLPINETFGYLDLS